LTGLVLACAAVVSCKGSTADAGGSAAAEAPADQAGGLLPEGAPAPDIELPLHTGKSARLSELRGKPVVVYFYPKDHTTGCTIQAEEMRDTWREVEAKGAAVFGVSTDDAASHQSFADDYELPFALVPDTEHRVAKAFGVPLRGGKVKRVTFIIDAGGRIAKVFPEVSPRGSAKEVVTALAGL
jgi:peroxiredoxin Q/BCP